MQSSGRPCKAPWNLAATPYATDALKTPGGTFSQSIESPGIDLRLHEKSTYGLHYARLSKKFYTCFVVNLAHKSQFRRDPAGAKEIGLDGESLQKTSTNKLGLNYARKLRGDADVDSFSIMGIRALLATLCDTWWNYITCVLTVSARTSGTSVREM